MSNDSPANHAGLKVGDALVEFGTIKSENFTSMSAIATIVEASKNENVRVRVLRDGAVKTLLLKPKPWSGRLIME